MARKDIEVRIRAKDDASRKAQKVAEAFKNLGTASQKLGTTGQKAGGVLSAMADDLTKIQGRIGGIDAFGKLVTQVQKATGVVDQLGKELAASETVMRQSQARSQAAAAASANLKSKIDAEVQAHKKRADQIKVTTARQNEETKAINDAAKAAERLQGALSGGKGGYNGPRYPKKGIGIEAGAPTKSARDSFSVFLAPEIDDALKNKAALDASVTSLREANKKAKDSIATLRQELKAASADERTLTGDTNKAEAQVVSLTDKLTKAKTALDKFDKEAKSASQEMGGLALSQEAVAAATDKAERELRQQAAALAAMRRYSDGAGGITNPQQAAVLQKHNALVAEARQEVKTLRDEQARLDQIIRSSSGNVTAQVDAYDRVTGAIKRSEVQLRKQELALRQAQGSALSGFGKWARAYNPIISGSQTAAAAQGRLASATVKSAASAGQIAPMAQRNANALKRQAAATDQAAQSMTKFGRDARTTLSFVQRMRGEVLALTTSFLGFYAALNRGQKAMDSFMAVEKAENRLGVAFKGDSRKVATEIDFLNDAADRLGFTFSALADGYGQISVAASSAGFSVADTRELFSSVAEAARVNGSSLDEMNGVLKAVNQMLSKGKVQAEELRGQLGDRMTGAFQLFAQGLGMTTEALDDALKKGEVYADRETMLKFARKLGEAYGTQVPSAMQKLAAALGIFERDMEKANLLLAEGFVPALKQALAAFHDFVNSAEGADTFRKIGDAAGKLIGILAQIPQHFDLIVAAGKVLLAIGIGRMFSGLVTSLGNARKSFIDVAGAISRVATPTNAFARAQRTILLGVRQTSFAMALYESKLRNIAAATTTGRIRILAWANAVSFARGAMLLGAAAARGLWAALGGPVGVGIAAVSLIFANWKTDTDKATAALQLHERQVEMVQSAYRNAAAGVTDWAQKIKGLTELDARNSVRTLEAQYNRALGAIQREANRTGRLVAQALRGGDLTNPDYLRDIRQLDDAIKLFLDGKLAVDDFRKGLSDLALNSTSDGVRDLAANLNDMLTKTDKNGRSIVTMREALDSARAVLKEVTGNGDEASKALLGLGERVEQVNDAFDKSSLIDTYTSAIEDLKSKIPGLSEEMDRLKKITELNKTAWDGMTAAWNAADYSKIAEIAGLWGQAVGAVNDQFLDKAVSGGLVDRIIGIESGGRANVKNPNSSATGAGQFIEKTWLSLFKKYFPERAESMSDAAMLELRKNADISRKMVDLYARENASFLQRMGVQINDANLYLAHFLGPQGAANLLRAAPGTQTSDILGADQISANASILEGKNAAQVVAWAHEKVGLTDQQVALGQDLAKLDEEAAKTAADQADATRKRIADLDHEIAQQRLINDHKEKEAAIQDAIRQARAENPAISEAEIASIREKTAALWEQQNATHELELVEERINNLQTLRQQLMEQMEQARAAGDQGQLVALQAEVDGVNARLEEAIGNAIRMWEAIGGEEAQAKIATLNTMKGAIAASKTEVGALGLTMQTWQGLFESGINGVVGAFERMAQAVVAGENAFKSFGVAVLQTLADVLRQIGAAIIKMLILKALQGVGGPMGAMATVMLGGMGVPTGHTGGIVGSSAIGSGNRIGPPTWMRNALTYHTGGIAGLRPDEVNATLRKGEEILTEEDDRHRFNQGGTQSAQQGPSIKQVLAIGEDEIANAMQGAAGERVMMTFIKRNRATLRQEFGY